MVDPISNRFCFSRIEFLTMEFCLEYHKREKITALSVLVGAMLIRFYVIPNYVDLPQEYSHASLSPAFFPILAVWFIMGLAVLYLIHAFLPARGGSRYQGDNDWISTGEERKAYVSSLIIIVYLLVLAVLGFLISTVMVLAVLFILQGVRKPLKVALISILVTIGVYLFFLYVMKVHFPEGIIFE